MCDIVNHRKIKMLSVSRLLPDYCDTLLKRGLKGVSESEVDDKLSLSITVFKYIDDKDVFKSFTPNVCQTTHSLAVYFNDSEEP